MAIETRLNLDMRLRQQLVMTPQLQQAIKILQLSLPELEVVVQNELDSNPLLEPLDMSVAETAANADTGVELASTEGEPLPAEPEPGTVDSTAEWESAPVEQPVESATVEAPDAAAEVQDPSLRSARLARISRKLFE